MDIDAMLQAYARHISAVMGKSTTTSTDELLQYGRRAFNAENFLGVFPADVTPPRTPHRCFYVQNTDASDQPGTHWVGIAREPGQTDVVFDSFARRPSPTFLPHLQHMVRTEDDVDQARTGPGSTMCGQLCMAFGTIFLHHGRNAALKC